MATALSALLTRIQKESSAFEAILYPMSQIFQLASAKRRLRHLLLLPSSSLFESDIETSQMADLAQTTQLTK
tara:strand:+ start:500 stop:715 length:216 start_codon:yes stop_codon:yes gene_type:complete